MIEIRGVLQPGDYIRAQYLHLRPRPTYKVLGVIVLGFFLWAGWLSISSGELEALDLVFFLAMAYLVLNFTVYLPWKTRRMYRQQKALQRESKIKFDEAGVTAENENGRTSTPWADFLKWKQNDELILLYFSDCMFHMIPKRFFAGIGEFENLREMLPSKIGAGER